MPAAPILVIKLGALGDIVLATGPFAAIRAHHPGARVTLLTTKPYAAWLGSAPYFDDIWIDPRPSALDLRGWLRLRQQLRSKQCITAHGDRARAELHGARRCGIEWIVRAHRHTELFIRQG